MNEEKKKFDDIVGIGGIPPGTFFYFVEDAEMFLRTETTSVFKDNAVRTHDGKLMRFDESLWVHKATDAYVQEYLFG